MLLSTDTDEMANNFSRMFFIFTRSSNNIVSKRFTRLLNLQVSFSYSALTIRIAKLISSSRTEKAFKLLFRKSPDTS